MTRFRLGRLFLLALADSCSADSLDAGSRRIADLLLQSEAHKWTGSLDYDEVQGRVDSFTDYLPIMRSSYSDARKLLSSELSMRFAAVDWAQLRAAMRRPLVVDGRNALDAVVVTAGGCEYCGCWGFG